MLSRGPISYPPGFIGNKILNFTALVFTLGSGLSGGHSQNNQPSALRAAYFGNDPTLGGPDQQA
jgi:hypothetical protein